MYLATAPPNTMYAELICVYLKVIKMLSIAIVNVLRPTMASTANKSIEMNYASDATFAPSRKDRIITDFCIT